MNYLKEIQNCSLDIMIDIDKVCRENDIVYSLCGGSVIGAKLYEGFIPWDDDIDIMMDRKNYDKFLQIYPKYSQKNYKLVNYNTTPIKNVPALFSRVIDINTETVELINNQKRKKGQVFVDITVFDFVPNKFLYYFYELKRYTVYMYYYKIHGLLPGVKWKRYIFYFISKNLSDKKIKEKYASYEKFCRKSSRKKRKYCAELLGTIFPGRLYNSNLFEQYIDIKFEDQKLMVVHDYDEYLFQRYGRREFTKENKGNIHSHIISFRRVK